MVWPGRLNCAASSRSASAMPTALEMPWPSGPVVVSTPGAQPRSGCPGVAAPSDDPRVKARPAWARLPLQKNHNWLGSTALRTLYLGCLNGRQCWAAELAEGAGAPAGTAWTGLRALYTVLDDAHFALAGRALQLVAWDRTHQYCGRCGARTEMKKDERARVCPAC